MLRRRGQGGGGGAGGGHDGAGSMRWLLTYADLITLLMVFFVVLYSISQLNQQKYIELSRALRVAFRMADNNGNAVIKTSKQTSLAPQDRPYNRTEDGVLANLGSQILQTAAQQDLSKDVHVSTTPEGLRVSFHSQGVFFAKARAYITPTFRRLLIAVSPLLRPLPNDIQVQGYTDNEPLYSRKYATSWELSAARAVRVLRLLADQGHVPQTHLSAVAFGQYHPLYSNATPAGQAKNRSVDLLVMRTPLQQPQAAVTAKKTRAPPTAP